MQIFFLLFPVLSPLFKKQEIYQFFPKSHYFTSIVTSYFIGKVSPIYRILAGFSSPETIFTYFLFCHHFSKNRIYQFSKITLFQINCYFIGKVSQFTTFLPVLVLRKPFLLISCFITTFQKKRKYVIFFQNSIISHQLLLHSP